MFLLKGAEMKCILILSRDEQEILHQCDASAPEEAKTKSEDLIQKEWQERQKKFPFTEEFPVEATLFCEYFTWEKWRRK